MKNEDYQAAMVEINGENYDGGFSADDFGDSFLILWMKLVISVMFMKPHGKMSILG